MGAAILQLTPKLFIELSKACKEGSPRKFVVREHPLPDDAEVVDIRRGDDGQLQMIIQSQAFSGDGQILPAVIFETIYD